MATESQQVQSKPTDKVASVKKELEQLFSDLNINEKPEVKQLLVEGPDGQLNERKWIPITKMLEFNEIKSQAENVGVDDVRNAVIRSRYLQLSEDGQQLRRQRYLDKSKRVHRSVVYVDRLPADVTIEWLRKVFGRFGEVDVVSLPTFQDSKLLSGCAYIEFVNEESAKNASKYYRQLYLRQVADQTFNKTWEDSSIDKSQLSEGNLKTFEVRQRQRRVLVNKLSRPFRQAKQAGDDQQNSEKAMNGNDSDEKAAGDQLNGAPEIVVEPLPAEDEKLANDLLVISLSFYLLIKQQVQTNMRRRQPRDNRRSDNRENRNFSRRSKVIRIRLDDNSSSQPIPKLRQLIRSVDRYRVISYTDLPVVENEDTYCYVRCKFGNRAAALAQLLTKFGTANVLNEEEEETYNTHVKKIMDEKRKARESGSGDDEKREHEKPEMGETGGDKPRTYPKGVILKIEAEDVKSDEPFDRQFKNKLGTLSTRRGIVFVDVPRPVQEDESDSSNQKTCYLRFQYPKQVADFLEQSDLEKTLGAAKLLNEEEEKEYWEKNIFARNGGGSRRNNNRRGFYNNNRERSFKARNFRPRYNHKKGGSSGANSNQQSSNSVAAHN